MKLDKDIQNVTQDGVYATTVATQLFLELLTMESHQFTTNENRKTLTYADVANAVNDIHEFDFLTEIIPYSMPYSEGIDP